MYSDTHLHLEGYLDAELEAMVGRARQAGVGVMVVAGGSLDASREAAHQASLFPEVYAGVGIHPWRIVAVDEEVYRQLMELTRQPKVVVVAEMGLDFVRDPSTKDVQIQAFGEQLRLAQETGLPIILHCRNAASAALDILHRAEGVTGAVHGFSDGTEVLTQWLELGFYISVGRAVLRPESEELRRLVPQIPQERLLVETDSVTPRLLRQLLPQMAPPSGENPEPAHVVWVAEEVARLRGETAQEVGQYTTDNLKRLLKLSG